MVSVALRRVLIAACAAGAFAAATLGGATGEALNQPAPTLASNQRAARLDAAQLLMSLQLSAGATRLPVEPAGDLGALKPMLGLAGTTARADVHAWWSVPGSPNSVLRYIEANRPASGAQAGTGTAYNGRSGASVQIVTYSWPPLTGVLGFRELQVWLTSLPGNATGVLAQAESDWIVPRPAGEQIPAGVREIDITSSKLNGPATVSLTITNAVEVRRIVALFDGMPIAQPGAYSCPAMLVGGARVMTFKFRTRAARPVLAQATYADYSPLDAPSGPCKTVDFAIRGRSQDALIGGEFVKQVERTTGASLTAG